MSKLTEDEIDADVDDAIRSLFSERFKRYRFSYSRTPSKPLNDGGLGASWNGWRALLIRLKAAHLRKRAVYKKFEIGPLLVDETLNKQLTSARRQIVKRLKICVDNS